MFQFRPFPTYPYLIQDTLTGDEPAGLPHSEISGSKLICSSPKLIAACHVFHRLLMPRHSPCTLYSLTFCLVTFWFSNKKFLELCRLLRGINCSLFYPFLLKSFHKLKCFTSLLLAWYFWYLDLALFSFQGAISNSFSEIRFQHSALLNAEIQPLKWWWAQVDSNHRPRAYQARALTCWAMSPRRDKLRILRFLLRRKLPHSVVSPLSSQTHFVGLCLEEKAELFQYFYIEWWR